MDPNDLNPRPAQHLLLRKHPCGRRGERSAAARTPSPRAHPLPADRRSACPGSISSSAQRLGDHRRDRRSTAAIRNAARRTRTAWSRSASSAALEPADPVQLAGAPRQVDEQQSGPAARRSRPPRARIEVRRQSRRADNVDDGDVRALELFEQKKSSWPPRRSRAVRSRRRSGCRRGTCGRPGRPRRAGSACMAPIGSRTEKQQTCSGTRLRRTPVSRDAPARPAVSRRPPTTAALRGCSGRFVSALTDSTSSREIIALCLRRPGGPRVCPSAQPVDPRPVTDRFDLGRAADLREKRGQRGPCRQSDGQPAAASSRPSMDRVVSRRLGARAARARSTVARAGYPRGLGAHLRREAEHALELQHMLVGGVPPR